MEKDCTCHHSRNQRSVCSNKGAEPQHCTPAPLSSQRHTGEKKVQEWMTLISPCLCLLLSSLFCSCCEMVRVLKTTIARLTHFRTKALDSALKCCSYCVTSLINGEELVALHPSRSETSRCSYPPSPNKHNTRVIVGNAAHAQKSSISIIQCTDSCPPYACPTKLI